MEIHQLVQQIKIKKSFLCVGLDTDTKLLPKYLAGADDPIFEFNKAIIDATHFVTVAYKPNVAFYEAQGEKGWLALRKTVRYIKDNYPEIFTIADAKRGDIGNTADMYARAFFDDLGFDSVTVAPYMGRDSVEPFLAHPNKQTILLALTSNPGAADFQLGTTDQTALFEKVLETSQTYQNAHNLMYVVGATRPEYFQQVRKIVPNSFLLVPGVGAQGGSLAAVCKYGLTDNIGLLVNASRAVIYASSEANFAEKAGEAAFKLQEEMRAILNKAGI